MPRCSKCKNKFDKKNLHSYKGSVLCEECYPFIVVNGKSVLKTSVKKTEIKTDIDIK